MAINDEDSLICDFAETYHILDYMALPCKLAATLAAGLPPGSRSMMGLAGAKIPVELMLEATIADRLGWLVWAQTKDGQKGRNRPESFVEILRGEKRKETLESFGSAEAFEARRAILIHRIEVDEWQQ